MSHQDLDVVKQRLKGQCLKVALQRLLSEVNWSQIKFRQDCTWTPKLLVLCHSRILGYIDLSLQRASSIFICQSTPR